MSEPQGESSKKIEVLEAAGGLVNVYANHAHLDWTLYDLRIRFGQLMYSGDPSLARLIVEERTAVTMAWAEAKALLGMLSRTIERYEQVNGEIKPPNLATSAE